MATKKNTRVSTLIGQLAKQRTTILGIAQKDGDRTLTDVELARFDALGSVIANNAPENNADRAILADIAYERVERVRESNATQEDIEVAYDALRSVWLTRPENKRAA